MRSFEPTTASQAAIWVADQYLGPSGAYNVAVILTVRGGMTRADVEGACRRLARATPALRIRMGIDRQGNIVQWFAPKGPVLEWLGTVAGDMADVYRRCIDRPFEADGGELTRFVACETSDGDIAVMIIGHHAVLDGLSQALIAERFVACLRGVPGSQSPGRYRDLVRWCIDREERAKSSNQDYWFDRVATGLGDGDWVASSRVAGRRENHRSLMPDSCHRRLSFLSARCHVSLFLMLMGAIHHTLAASGMSRTVVCTAVSLRPPDGSCDDVVGCFVGQIPLIAASRQGESLADLVLREAPHWQCDLRRRHTPFPVIISQLRGHGGEKVRIDRVITSFRRSQSLMAWHLGSGDVVADIFNKYYSAKTDLSVRFMARGSGLEYDIEWSADAPVELSTMFDARFMDAAGEERA